MPNHSDFGVALFVVPALTIALVHRGDGVPRELADELTRRR
jgi:hypothetical protein